MKEIVRRLPSEQFAVRADLRLNALDTLNTELDYGHSLHSLYSNTSTADGLVRQIPATLQQVKTRPGWKPAAPRLEDDQMSGNGSFSLLINQDDFKQALSFDILDPHRLSEKLYDKRVGMPVFSDAQRQRMAEKLDMAAITDRLLKEAYNKLIDTAIPVSQKKKLCTLIQRLQRVPHLYRPTRREEPTDVHVSRWLLCHTDKPEAEVVGFTSSDPFEPRRFIDTVKPRLSSSDTRVVLGKRKRVDMEEDECEVGATDSGSDTLLAERRDCVRPLGAKRRRASMQRRRNTCN